MTVKRNGLDTWCRPTHLPVYSRNQMNSAPMFTISQDTAVHQKTRYMPISSYQDNSLYKDHLEYTSHQGGRVQWLKVCACTLKFPKMSVSINIVIKAQVGL